MLKKLTFLLLLIVLGMAGKTTYKHRHSWALWWTLQKTPLQWETDQIAQDFLGIPSITEEALDETFQKVVPYGTFRYRITKGEIYRSPVSDPNGRAYIYDKIIMRLNKAKQLPDLDFLLCTMDGIPEAYVPKDFWITKNQAPILAQAKKNKDTPFVISIPDCLTTRESSWNQEIDKVNEKYRSLPWGQRIEKAFWRGNSNIFDLTVKNYQEKPRFLISFLSTQYPNLLDAGFSGVHQHEMRPVFEQMGLILGHTLVSDHVAYKYLPAIDGYMCTFPGFQWRLLSGSLTFKQDSEDGQYFYSALKPYVHYIPIKSDMSDLIEKIAWAQSHDTECRQIAENARAFALENFIPEKIYSYFYRVLEKHASLQAFQPKKPVGSEWEQIK